MWLLLQLLWESLLCCCQMAKLLMPHLTCHWTLPRPIQPHVPSVCTMAHKLGRQSLDRTLQDMKQNLTTMSGAAVFLCGDFRQTLPVIPRGSKADEINACLRSSLLWSHASPHYEYAGLIVTAHWR